MQELTPETITDAVLDQMSTTSDPRLKEIMAAAVKHLHAFARDVNLTPGEWIKGIEFQDVHAGPAGVHSALGYAGPVGPRQRTA